MTVWNNIICLFLREEEFHKYKYAMLSQGGEPRIVLSRGDICLDY